MKEHIQRLRLIGPRTRRAVFVTVAAIVALVLVIPAFAGPVGTNAGFEDDDGNLTDDAATGIDWNSFAATTVWSGTAPLRTAAASASGWTMTGKEDRAAVTTDSAFAGGTKQDDNCATVGAGKAPNKDDLERVYLATKTVPVSGVDHVFLMLAWVRIPQNTTSPSAHIGFEFNKGTTACSATSPLVQRTAGDMLIVYDFEGGAGDAPVLTLRRWVTSGSCEVGSVSPPCWGTATNLTANGDAEGRVNTLASVSDTVAAPDDTLGLNEFGEAGIDLTAAGVFTAGQCESFGNSYAVSRSSGNSGTAQMKDLVGPVPFTLQNCGTVKIIKQTDPRGLNQEFAFTSNLAGTQLSCTQTGGTETPTSFSLNDSGNSGKTLGSTADAQNSAANTQTCTNVPTGSYTVTEGSDPTGFAFKSLTCSATGTGTSVTPTSSTSNKTASITLAGGGSVTCLYQNGQQLGAIKITKTSTKGNAALAGARFRVCTNDGPYTAQNPCAAAKTGSDNLGPTDANGVVCIDNLAFGTYYVSERSAPTGYNIDDTTVHAVTVNTNSSCPNTNIPAGQTLAFADTPLSEIQVIFRSLAGEGVTAAQIVCSDTGGAITDSRTTEDGDDDNSGGDPGDNDPVFDDTDETFTNLVPGTYDCEIIVDP